MKKYLFYLLFISLGSKSIGQTTDFEVPGNVIIGKNVLEIDAYDFDNDGHMDFFACAGYPEAATIGFGDGKGMFSTVQMPLKSVITTIGDFNNDGFKDIASLSSNSVNIYLNNGNRTFASPYNFNVGPSVIKLISGDFNGDARSDIAIGYSGGSVSVYLGKADATFNGPITTNISNSISDWTIGDINRDGYTDIVTCNKSGNLITILRATGSGMFTYSEHSVGSTNYPSVIKVADFNNDSFLDIVTGNTGLASKSVSVFLSSGGNFSTFTSYAAGEHAVGITIADFNRDGKTDIATSNINSGNISVLLNSGIGIFSDQAKFMAGNRPIDITSADFDEDAYADILVGNFNSMDLSLLKGKGDGSFYSSKSYYAQGALNPIILDDFNGDGKKDELITLMTGNGSLSSFRVHNEGIVSLGASNCLTCGGASEFIAADFDKDGKKDIVFTGSMSIGFYKGLGNGLFKSPTIFSTGISVNKLISGDFNGDRNLDVIVAGMENKIVLMQGNGTGNFFASPALSVTGIINKFCKGDFNNDNKLDAALVTNGSGSNFITILSGTGFGSFIPSTVPFSPFSNSYIESVDFDMDGNDDLVVYSTVNSDSITILKGKGNNSFIPYKSYSAKSGRLRIDDLNNDSIPDIIATSSNYLNLLIGKGDATFLQSTLFIGAPVNVLTSDINLDGWKDLFVANSSVDNISVVFNTSMGALSEEPNIDVSNFSITDLSSTAVTLNFTPGNGDGRIIVVRKGTPILDYPVDGFNYKEDTVFGHGDLLSEGNYVVYNGASNSVTITGLSPSSTYYIKVFEYNGTGGSINYSFHSSVNQVITTLSEVTSNFVKKPYSAIEIYPNPAEDNILINTGSINLSDAVITIQNNLGEIVYIKSLLEVDKSQNLSLQEMNSGLYLITIKSNEGTWIEKIFIR
jgi:hypothetical protein